MTVASKKGQVIIGWEEKLGFRRIKSTAGGEFKERSKANMSVSNGNLEEEKKISAP